MNDRSSETDWRPPPWQFSLRTVFVVFLVVASGLAAMGPWGLVAVAVVVATALCGHLNRIEPRYATWLFYGVFCALFAVGVVSVLFPTVEGPLRPRPRWSCLNNLKQVALALSNYRSTHGSFPPAYLADEGGRPTHSWRTLILPNLEQGTLYRHCRLEEPWDAPNNAMIAQTFIMQFRCPREYEEGPGADYVAVVGPNTVWPGEQGISLDDIPDGAADTILLIEWPDSDIHWMEPRDVSFEELCGAAGGNGRRRLPSIHIKDGGWLHHSVPVIHAAMADGRVRLLPADISAEQLAALLTRNGGEPIDLDALEVRPPVNWGRILAVIVFGFSSLWLIFGPAIDAERRMLET